LESAATQRLDSLDSRLSSLAKSNQEQFEGLSTRWLEMEEHVHAIKEAQKARDAKVDERLA
jgi:phage shock protein A